MKQLSNLKFMAMAFFVALLGMSLTACSDDDDDSSSSISDYYITCSVSGGGLSSQQKENMESSLNSELTNITMKGVERDRAIYSFDSLMDELEDEYSEGMSGISGTLTLTFYLKDKDGKTVKTTSLKITKDGCTKG